MYRAQHRTQGLGPGGPLNAGPGGQPAPGGGQPAPGPGAQDPMTELPSVNPGPPATASRVPSFTPAAGFTGPRTPAAPAPAAPEAKSPPGPNAGDGDLLYRVLGGLAMRDLTLVESLLQVVEKLESNEDDPGQLELLFRIDHLATRMRRNSENLLVLAGHDPQGRDLEPVPLVDVARAAVSEITDYSRAQVSSLPDIEVLGVAADDLSHILAELLENATSKSPESATVVIRAERTGDGTMVISVEDSGIGIPSDQLKEINTRLGRPPVIDSAVTRHLGLYVVGRLAQRHGIRVQLRERKYGGISANVITPSRLVRGNPTAPPQPAARVPAASLVPPAPAPSALPAPSAPRFAPADRSMLPQRTPSRGAPTPVPPAPTPTLPTPPLASRADRIRDELADFRLGQQEAQAAAPGIHHSNGFRPRGGEQEEAPPAEGNASGPDGGETGSHSGTEAGST